MWLSMTLVVDSRIRPFQQAVSILGTALLLGMVCTGCGGGSKRIEQVHIGETQGTTYSIKYVSDQRTDQAKIDSVLRKVDEAVNLWMPGSVISRLNNWDRTDTVFAFVDSSLVWSVIYERSRSLYQESEGAFDPTVQPLVELWGFGLSRRKSVASEDVDAVMPHVGFEWSRLDMNEVFENRVYKRTEMLKRDSLCGLDFNSIAQGYTVDLLADLLLASDVADFMVEVGGEVKCHGTNGSGEPWRIAIDKPVEDWSEGRQLEAVVALKNAAICTSGNYRKFYLDDDGVRRSHTIDPRTGYPVEHTLLSATIRASDAALADGLATTCMVLGPEAGKEFIMAYRQKHPEESIEAFWICSDERGEPVHWLSPGWGESLVFYEE